MALTETQKNKAWAESYVLMEERWEAMLAEDRLRKTHG
jgi:hypothetical protein